MRYAYSLNSLIQRGFGFSILCIFFWIFFVFFFSQNWLKLDGSEEGNFGKKMLL
jgi:hypothetical protein